VQIVGSVKCKCLFRLRGYLLIAGDWSLKVGEGVHNHYMADVLKGHKIIGRLNPNERIHLYVESTILGSLKEKIVMFWVNKFMHIENTTTNRVESAHSQLKKYMTSSMGDLSTN